MRLGLGSFACAWEVGVPGFPVPQPMKAVDFLNRAARYGLRVAQLADNLGFEQYSPAQLTDVRDAARLHGITIELATRGLSMCRLESVFRMARFLDAPLLRLITDTSDSEPAIEQIIETIGKLVPALRASSLTLALENHDRLTANELAYIVQEVGCPEVGICLDTVNSFGALEGPHHVISTLAKYTLSLHLKDFTIARMPHAMGFTIFGTPAGEGKLQVPRLLETLQAAGRDPNVILELWPPPEADVLTTIRKEQRWCELSIRYLRTLIPD